MNRQETEEEGYNYITDDQVKRSYGLSHVKYFKARAIFCLQVAILAWRGLVNKISQNSSESYLKICFHITDILFIYQRLKHYG